MIREYNLVVPGFIYQGKHLISICLNTEKWMKNHKVNNKKHYTELGKSDMWVNGLE